MCGIYKITNIKNKKIYIGQSKNIEARWNKHRNAPFNPNDKGYNSYFYHSIRKYGLDNFSFEVIEQCSIDELNEKEIYWIHFYQSNDNRFGYNLTSGGNNTHLQKLTDKDIDEIYFLLKNTSLTQTEVAKKFNTDQSCISLINYGIIHLRQNETYPLRKPYFYTQNKKYCVDCRQEISPQAIRCLKCEAKRKTKIEISREELKLLIRTQSFLSIGKKLGVSDTAIRKWCDKYDLPRTKEAIKRYTDEEWENI